MGVEGGKSAVIERDGSESGEAEMRRGDVRPRFPQIGEGSKIWRRLVDGLGWRD